MLNIERKQLGRLLDEEETKKVIKSLRGKFLGVSDLPNWKGEKKPAWCNFLEEFNLKQVSFSVLDDFLSGDKHYYIYFEFSKEVRLTTQIAIRNYFTEKPQWFNHDIYIFPLDYKWCIVNNHDDEFLLYMKQL